MTLWPTPGSDAGSIPVSTARLLALAGVELTLIATLGTWLWRLGWRPHSAATKPFEFRDLLRGPGLWLATYLAYVISIVIWSVVTPEFTRTAVDVDIVGSPALWLIVPLSLLNAVVEEFLWLGLGVAALTSAGVRPGIAGTISVALRVLVHVYQGPMAIIAILPLGLLYTIYYVRSRRLWPVVVAHAIKTSLPWQPSPFMHPERVLSNKRLKPSSA